MAGTGHATVSRKVTPGRSQGTPSRAGSTEDISPLDAAGFPHLLESIISYSAHTTLLAWRRVSRTCRDLADAQLYRHIVLRGNAWIATTSRRPLPLQLCGPGGRLPSPPPLTREDIQRVRRYMRVLEILHHPASGLSDDTDFGPYAHLAVVRRSLSPLAALRGGSPWLPPAGTFVDTVYFATAMPDPEGADEYVQVIDAPAQGRARLELVERGRVQRPPRPVIRRMDVHPSDHGAPGKIVINILYDPAHPRLHDTDLRNPWNATARPPPHVVFTFSPLAYEPEGSGSDGSESESAHSWRPTASVPHIPSLQRPRLGFLRTVAVTISGLLDLCDRVTVVGTEDIDTSLIGEGVQDALAASVRDSYRNKGIMRDKHYGRVVRGRPQPPYEQTPLEQEKEAEPEPRGTVEFRTWAEYEDEVGAQAFVDETRPPPL